MTSSPSTGTYVLEGREPKLADAKVWGDWMDDAELRIGHTEFHTAGGKREVNTFFFGVDAYIAGLGPFFFCTTITSEPEITSHDTQKITPRYTQT